MLHRVLPDAPTAFGLPSAYRMRGTALTPEELVAALDGAGPILGLRDVEAALATGTAIPRGSVLTFDDGYREHLDVVAPLLARRGATATFYVASGLRGDLPDVAVVDAWYWLLDHARRREAEAPLPDGRVFRGRIDTPTGKAQWVGGAPKAALLAVAPTAQRAMLRALADSVGSELPPDLAAQLYLNRNDWASLTDLGMVVGAHSVLHPRLPQLDDAALHEEVSKSVEAVATLGGPVPFAYPDGAFDDRVVGAMRLAGVSSAVTCQAGSVDRGTDRMRLPREFVRASSAGCDPGVP